MTTLTKQKKDQANDQYSLAKILGIWAIASLPMVVLTRWVNPVFGPRVNMHPGIFFWWMMIIGMIWLYVVSMWIVWREEGDLRWSTIRRRFWLNRPRDPQTGELRAKLFWWLIPGILIGELVNNVLAPYLNRFLALFLPNLTTPVNSDITALAIPEFEGAWWLVAIMGVSAAFNYFLGEEFLFRGVLLPKMRGAFGKWDWVANAVLFGLYHIHWAPAILTSIIWGLLGNWLSRRYRSTWFVIIIHGVEVIPVILGVMAVVLGLM
jgi:uncharacterized protein